LPLSTIFIFEFGNFSDIVVFVGCLIFFFIFYWKGKAFYSYTASNYLLVSSNCSCTNQAMLKLYTSKQLAVTMLSNFSVAFGSLGCSSGTPVTYNNNNDRYNIAIMYWLILFMNLCTEMDHKKWKVICFCDGDTRGPWENHWPLKSEKVYELSLNMWKVI
jgi:hypothetical protein